MSCSVNTVAMGQAGWLNKSTVAQNRPAASRPAASGNDAVHVAPTKQAAAIVFVMVRQVS